MILHRFIQLFCIGFILQSCQTQNECSTSDPSFFTDDSTAKAITPPGFRNLFDGTEINHSHWQGLLQGKYQYPQNRQKLKPAIRQLLQKEANALIFEHWSVKDNSLFFDGAQGRPYNLSTSKDYADFELYISWKLNKNGDSGIYLRGLPQIQIWDPSNKKAHIYGAHKGSGGLWNNTRNGKDLPGRWPLIKADNPIGNWNHFFIRMIDNYVTVYLNGKLVVNKAPLNNLWLSTDQIPRQGPIELQCHNDPVYFKNIFIRELPQKR